MSRDLLVQITAESGSNSWPDCFAFHKDDTQQTHTTPMKWNMVVLHQVNGSRTSLLFFRKTRRSFLHDVSSRQRSAFTLQLAKFLLDFHLSLSIKNEPEPITDVFREARYRRTGGLTTSCRVAWDPHPTTSLIDGVLKVYV